MREQKVLKLTDYNFNDKKSEQLRVCFEGKDIHSLAVGEYLKRQWNYLEEDKVLDGNLPIVNAEELPPCNISETIEEGAVIDYVTWVEDFDYHLLKFLSGEEKYMRNRFKGRYLVVDEGFTKIAFEKREDAVFYNHILDKYNDFVEFIGRDFIEDYLYEIETSAIKKFIIQKRLYLKYNRQLEIVWNKIRKIIEKLDYNNQLTRDNLLEKLNEYWNNRKARVKNINLAKLYEIYNKKYFNNKLPNVEKVQFEWDNSIRKTAGSCYKNVHKIRMSVDYHMEYINEVKSTFLHEMAHLIHKGHGKDFKMELARIENNFKDCNHLRYLRYNIPSVIRYKHICPECGRVWEYSYKTSKDICGTCDKKIDCKEVYKLK